MPLALASMYQLRWHRSLVPLAVAAGAALGGAEKAVQAVNAMPCKYSLAAGRTWTMSTYK